MTTTPYQTRRATIEDLPQLRLLWEQERLPVEELEKRFKEFQVVAYETGEVIGGIGLAIAGLEGLLYGEVFLHFEQADALREALWQRVQILAKNFGLVRIWTQLATPFWRQQIFQPASAPILEKLPPQFGSLGGHWLWIQLKEETAGKDLNLEQELALLKAAERERTESLLRQAKLMKGVAAVVAVGVFLLAILWAIYFFKLQRQMPLR